MPANAAPRSSTSSSTAASAAFVRAAYVGTVGSPKTSRCWSGCRFRARGVGTRAGAKKTGRFESIALTIECAPQMRRATVSVNRSLTGLTGTLERHD